MTQPGDSPTIALSTDARRHESPWFRPNAEAFAEGDLVLLVTADQSRYLITLRGSASLHTHQGVFEHAAVLGKRSGDSVVGVQGHAALVLEPALNDLMRHVKRGSQVIYAKDAAWLIHRMSLRAGSVVVEAGTGSGGLTIALAWAVAPSGMVHTYEVRDDAYRVSRNNLERAGLLPYVRMALGAVEDGFRERNADAVFLDVREPWRFMSQVRTSLRPGGIFAGLLPTTNQVSRLLEAMESEGFTEITVEEMLLRTWKPVPDRLRPDDTMAAHTGFLISGRMLADMAEAGRWLSRSRQRYLARKQAEERIAEEERMREGNDGAGAVKYPPMPLP